MSVDVSILEEYIFETEGERILEVTDELVAWICEEPSAFGNWKADHTPDEDEDPDDWEISPLILRFVCQELTGKDLSWKQLQFAQMRGSDWSHTTFYCGSLWQADLREAKCFMTDFTRCNLRQARLANADFTGASFRDADLSFADLQHADLRHADFSGAQLYRANLRGANLTSANLAGIEIHDADLTGANLTRANLSGASLSNTRIEGACLSDTNLGDVNLSKTQGLASVIHGGPSIFDFQSLRKSKVPRHFLEGCGIPVFLVEGYAMIQTHKKELVECLLVCAESEQSLVEPIQKGLNERGIRCWIRSEVAPYKLHSWQRIVLCCSETSLMTEWLYRVNQIVGSTENPRPILTIGLDRFLHEKGFRIHTPERNSLMTRYVADFTSQKREPDYIHEPLNKLEHAIRNPHHDHSL